MYGKSIKLRSFLTLLVFLLAAVALLNRTTTIPASADSGTTSLIVELRGDAAAVYKAKVQKAGGSVSDEQLQAYREQVRGSQDQFLGDLKSLGYKVCAAVGSCLTAATNLAIEDAVSPRTLTLQPKPVADVINLSLGGVGGPDDSSAVAASNAALLGTTVVASAGNEGPGENTVGSPAAGRHVIAVGANNEPAGGSNTVDLIGGRTQMIANLLDGATPPSADITQNYVYCGFAETPDQVPDSVNGRIALIARGGTVNTPEGLPTSAGTGLFSNKSENGGNSMSAASAALFGYSTLLGADQVFAPAEKTGKRTLQFRDNASEMFSFDAIVTAYQNGSNGASGGGGGAAGAPAAGGSSSGNILGLPALPKVMRFTVNPLTKAVTAKLL